jgi:hypothetical protein
MALDAGLEVVNSSALKTEVTRILFEELGVHAAARDPSKRGSKVRGVDLRVAAKTVEIVIEGKSYSGARFMDAVGAAFDQYLGKSQDLYLLTAAREIAPVIAKVLFQVPHAVMARQAVFTEARLDALVDVYLPNDPLAKPMADIERDNAEVQARFIETVKCYSADEIAQLAGHEASNRSASASRWKTQGAIFGVRRLGRDRYPAFQFQDGRPRKVIGKILKALPEDMSPWQTAMWFSSPNGWLDGAAPMDRLADEAALLAAATHEGDDWQG